MSGTDPAMEATDRAHRAYYGTGKPWTTATVGVDCAREALAPIRALHKPVAIKDFGETWVDCTHDGLPWPCSTAKLIYTAEELSDD